MGRYEDMDDDDFAEVDGPDDMGAPLHATSRLFHKSFKPNRGRQTAMNSIATSGGFNVVATQLIADVEPKPQQWMITIGPPMAQSQVSLPWQSTFDGTTNGPSSSNFQAPVLPVLGLQCFLQFRAGAVAYQSAFDYPYNGAVFGLTADTVQLDVVLKQGQTPILYPTQAAIPVIGAFMVEGRPATQSPLRWMDVPAVLAISSALTPTFWPVRPFARKLTLICPSCPANDEFEFFWVNAAGSAVYQQFWNSGALTYFEQQLDIPPTAVAYSLTHSSTAQAATIQPVSEISYA